MSNFIFNDNFNGKVNEHAVNQKATEKKRLSVALVICAALMAFAGLMVFGAGLFNFLDKDSTQKITYISSNQQSENFSPMVAEENSLVNVIDRVKDSVVEISSKAGNLRGSGVIVGKYDGIDENDGYYVITSAHIVKGDVKNTYVPTVVKLNDGTTYSAELAVLDEKSDIAVLKINEPKKELVCATWADPSEEPSLGEQVIAIGSPVGVTIGYLSATKREMSVNGTKMDLIQTDGALTHGNSGGALFNRSGALIGISNARVEDENSSGLGFAVPHNVAYSVYNSVDNRFSHALLSLIKN